MPLEESAAARYLGEFIGTFVLVFTVGCNVLAGNYVWGVTSIACVLMVMIYAMANVSGSNFNPAVSLALACTNNLSWMEAGIYIACQLAGAVVGGFSYFGLYGKNFNLAPSPGFHWAAAGAVEVLYTFMLCFAVLNCAAASSQQGRQFYGLAIGFSVIAGGYGGGAISGGCFNPAIAVGVDITSANLGFGWCLAYMGFELIGAALAVAMYRVVRPQEFGSAPPASAVQGKASTPQLVSEFLGTFMLVLTVGLNVLTNVPFVWSIAAALTVMIFSLGDVSGAHFNPAVTVAVMASGRRKCGILQGITYMVAQCVGSIAAAFTFTACYDFQTFDFRPDVPYNLYIQLGCEMVFTFLLCYVVLAVATVQKPLSEYFGLAIGSCVTVGGYAVGNISGGVLNPAVAIGLSTVRLVDTHYGWWHCLAYSLAELIGSGLAAAFFRVTHRFEFQAANLPLKAQNGV
eukprot:gnl/TRDRNA2_/TRDRNA2_180240_c0_seq1.p1 gnl/TRDRNA2_/TRDRNA2_180240_c0~~gnl/TRDRNA2_/TRDRNA2_180240_c0_seq1.p1  ORF type:complete len:458 (-),score=57.40 gnl/TRDRNA2_/TRDRNA2_180240_c0_seq1:127-1500(-)